MLVLSRRLNEELIIDGCIRVVVLSVQGQRVRLGISAPEDMTIRRGEIELALPEMQADYECGASAGDLVHV